MTIHYVDGKNQQVQEMITVDETEESSLFVPYIGIWGFFTMISCFITSVWVVRERPIVFSRIMTTYKGLSSYSAKQQELFCFFIVDR